MYTNIRKLLIIIFFYFFNPYNSISQSKNIFNDNIHKIGFLTGYGSQSIIPVDYEYSVKYFQIQYYYSLYRQENWGIDFLTQPQYNITRLRFLPESQLKKGYEYGCNFGFLLRKNYSNDFISIYTLISAGPHYVSATPNRQTNGFIFSDNLLFGVNVRVAKKLSLDLRGGIRHISNARLEYPNGGVNDLLISFGFYYLLGASN